MKLIKWLVTSSANAEKISLTVKGIAATVVTWLALAGTDPQAVQALPSLAEQGVLNFFHLVALIANGVSWAVAVWGILRKIHFGRWSALR